MAPYQTAVYIVVYHIKVNKTEKAQNLENIVKTCRVTRTSNRELERNRTSFAGQKIFVLFT